MIIEKYKTIFIHIPKNAGTAIKDFFNKDWDNGLRVPRVKIHKHDTIYQIKLKTPELYNSFKKFAVVRNPYDRTLSWYIYIKGKNTKFKKWLKNPTHKLEPQRTWVDDTVEILKFENLNEELNNFFGEKIDLPLVNRSDHDNYLKYYNQESLDVVYNRYKEDFEKFNYKKI